MKAKLILIAILSFCALTGSSQQPFAEYGYKVKVATLSKGKYVEFFDQDTLVQIGTVVMNRFTKQIVSFVTVDTAYSEATLQPELISRWISPDPLAEKYYSYSPYHFSGNNPIRYVDPTGMYFIDYYDQGGNKIGTDGNNDGRVVVVTDNKEAKSIKATDKAGGTTAMASVKSGVELPSASVRAEMGAAVDRSNAPNASVGDKQGGFHEEGGIYGLDASGTQITNAALPGPVANPQTDPHAEIDVWSGEQGNITQVQGTYHVHPRGEVSVGPGANTIGPTTTYGFDQPPSSQDYTNAAGNKNPSSAYHTTGNNYVLGAKSGTVYIYNGNSTKPVATFPLKEFRTIR
ncbi:MAG: hypothetical protein IT213_11100 [Cytophagales bacterium]|nr:hypothetical protein [Cytophagales bacterium]